MSLSFMIMCFVGAFAGVWLAQFLFSIPAIWEALVVEPSSRRELRRIAEINARL